MTSEGPRGAVVTGAGSGIGRATALLLAREGFAVVAADLDLAAAERTAAECPGGLAMAVDVADGDSVIALFEQVGERLGSLDALVNVAGIGSTASTPDLTESEWDRVMAVNVRGTFVCCREALRLMLPRRAGSIVNIASIAGMVGLRNRAAYCASKGAVISYTRALAIDHVADGIRANCICPGTVDSPWVRRLVEESGESLDALRARQPMGRLGQPQEVAESVAYLVSDRAAFVTGSALVIDGGLTAA